MNWNKAFIIVIDKGGILSSFNSTQFHNSITNAQGVKNWWHYIDNSYILITDWAITAKNITDFIMKITPNTKFFICELKLNNHNGWLPPEAWEWINKQLAETSS